MAIFEYDGDVNVLYYRLTDKPVKGTASIGNRVNVDYDEDGEAVGIEVISPPGFSAERGTPSAAPSVIVAFEKPSGLESEFWKFLKDNVRTGGS